MWTNQVFTCKQLTMKDYWFIASPSSPTYAFHIPKYFIMIGHTRFLMLPYKHEIYTNLSRPSSFPKEGGGAWSETMKMHAQCTQDMSYESLVFLQFFVQCRLRKVFMLKFLLVKNCCLTSSCITFTIKLHTHGDASYHQGQFLYIIQPLKIQT